ncbi:MAG: peptidase T [Sphaerochaetaceae bacterium]|nr:peptidase T [Sphaerochaetaceae bacterium]
MSDFSYATPILNRFLSYTEFDTMSDPHAAFRPSTPAQNDLLHAIEEDLHSMGFGDTTFLETGYLIARIPANVTRPVTPVAFMAHVDVADDVQGNGVKARVIERYDGNDVRLNETYTLTVQDNPLLKKHTGSTIVVTDGTTLLGADDKAGVAIIMALGEYISTHPEFEHGPIEFVFTSDEETGEGMDAFDSSLLGAKVCYTIDGTQGGEVEAECFNAATVSVDFYGIPCHLGSARGKLVNSVSMASSFITMVPKNESPEATDGRYGYYCADDIKGTLEHTSVTFHLRDFERGELDRRIEALKSLASTTEKLFPGGKVTVEEKIVYTNMADYIKKDPKVMESIFASGKEAHIELQEKLIRGGTDGARLSAMGIPTPNIFTGGHNLHSRYEWLALDDAVDCASLITEIVRYWVK